MENSKFLVYYELPLSKGGDSRTAVIEASDLMTARNMADHMFGNVKAVNLHSVPKLRQPSISSNAISPSIRSFPSTPPLDIDTEDGPLQAIGRSLAREQLGVVGESLSDRTISVLILLVLGLPVVGLWLGLPVYKASLIAPTMGFPPVTLCIGAGATAFCVGWLILYLCPIFLLRGIGFAVYAGWFLFYVAGWHLDADLLQSAFVKALTTNTDVTNLQKVGFLFTGLAGFSVMGNLGKVARGS